MLKLRLEVIDSKLKVHNKGNSSTYIMKFTRAKVSRKGHTSNLEIHLRRIPFSDLKGTRKI
jgi:hypothetical protein